MLHILRLTLSNVYLITGEKVVLIDTGRPQDVPRIRAFMKTCGIETNRLALILVTHGHWDHAGGAARLRDETKAPIAIHRADADLARRGSNGNAKPTCLTGYLIRAFVNRGYPAFEPDVIVDGEIDLQGFGVDARILETPGHTPGSISVLTGDGDAIIGDLLMGGYLGGWLFPTRPGLHYFADDLDQLHASIRKVIALSPRSIHPGHGGPLDVASVARIIGA